MDTTFLFPLAASTGFCRLVGHAAIDPVRSDTPYIVYRLPAGFPSPAADYTEAALDLNTYLIVRPAASYLFDVDGDSMIGAGIYSGDKVLVDRSIEPLNGHIVVAVLDGDYTLKRLYRSGSIIELRPESPRYRPIPICEGNQLQIWGVVTGVVRKVRV